MTTKEKRNGDNNDKETRKRRKTGGETIVI